MKTISTLILLALFTTLSYGQEKELGHDITVTIDNVTSNDGHVLLGLHTKDTFMKGHGIQSLKSKIEDGKVKVTFKNVTPGDYAIMALHDKNDNERMDFDSCGMPQEPYGMSNNPMNFGPPQFHLAQFKITDDNLNLAIRF